MGVCQSSEAQSLVVRRLELTLGLCSVLLITCTQIRPLIGPEIFQLIYILEG